MPVTLQARRDLAEGVVRLSLWLARERSRDGESFRAFVPSRTGIYPLTDLYEHRKTPAATLADWRQEKWARLLVALEAVFARHASDATSQAFEEEGFELLWPHLEPCLADDLATWPRIENRPFGFFTCDPPRADQAEPFLDLHLANPFAPRSPFADLPARAGELSRLLDEAASADFAPVRATSGRAPGWRVPPSHRSAAIRAGGGSSSTARAPSIGRTATSCGARGGFRIRKRIASVRSSSCKSICTATSS